MLGNYFEQRQLVPVPLAHCFQICYRKNTYFSIMFNQLETKILEEKSMKKFPHSNPKAVHKHFLNRT